MSLFLKTMIEEFLGCRRFTGAKTCPLGARQACLEGYSTFVQKQMMN